MHHTIERKNKLSFYNYLFWWYRFLHHLSPTIGTLNDLGFEVIKNVLTGSDKKILKK
jgi:hypothetical protein